VKSRPCAPASASRIADQTEGDGGVVVLMVDCMCELR
jgi:hypothetical protein